MKDVSRLLAVIGLSSAASACGSAAEAVGEERTTDQRQPNDGQAPPGEVVEAEQSSDSSSASAPDEGADSELEPSNGAGVIQGVLLLDDAEDGDADLLARGELVGGHWFTFDDRQDCRHPDFAAGNVGSCGGLACAASGMIIPVPEAYGAPRLETWSYEESGVSGPPLEGKQRSNERGLRVQASAHTFEGAGLAVDLQGDGAAYELTQVGAVGVRFLARSGIATSTIPLRVEISDGYSDAAGGRCVARASVCDEETCTCEGDVQGCGDHPRAQLAATQVGAEWTIYQLLFSDFVREGTGEYVDGVSPPQALELGSVHQLRFVLPTNGEPLPEYDLWLDDIGLIVGR